MTAAFLAFAALLLTILGFVIRISYQTGRLMQKVDDHVKDESRHLQPRQQFRRPAPRRS